MTRHIIALDPLVDLGWEHLRRLRNECREHMTGDTGYVTPEAQEAFRRRFDPLLERAYLVLAEGWPVGFLYARLRDGTWVPTYGVGDGHRRRGHGQFLVRLSQLLFPAMRLAVLPSNERAIGLYQSCGFVAWGGNERALFMKWEAQ